MFRWRGGPGQHGCSSGGPDAAGTVTAAISARESRRPPDGHKCVIRTGVPSKPRRNCYCTDSSALSHPHKTYALECPESRQGAQRDRRRERAHATQRAAPMR